MIQNETNDDGAHAFSASEMKIEAFLQKAEAIANKVFGFLIGPPPSAGHLQYGEAVE